MKKLSAVMVIVVVGFSLGACVKPQVAGKSAGSITFKGAMTYNIGEQYELAEAHCQTYGKTAEEVPDDRPDGMHTFKCVAQ